MAKNTNKVRAAKQEISLLDATAWGLPWEGEDVDLVAETMDIDVAEVAETLNRTVFGVEAVRQALREGRKVGGGHGKAVAPNQGGWDSDDPRWG